MNKNESCLEDVSVALVQQSRPVTNADHTPSELIEPSKLYKRVRALEVVLAMERKLRLIQQEALRNLEAASARPFGPEDLVGAETDNDETIPLRPARVDVTQSTSFSSSDTSLSSRASELSLPFDTPPLPRSDGEERLLPLLPGFCLHEYRIDSVLGQGGFGITYLATDLNLDVKVAIKEYLPASVAYRASDQSVAPRCPEDQLFYLNGLDSFLLEARTLATFRHPNIVRVARFFEAHQTAYMVLDYERGESLKTWWGTHGSLPEQDLLGLLRPLMDGLTAVHEAGYLHRDIKPDNIYVRREDGSLVLLDFGAARQAVGGEQGPWTDIYALGATLYWMVAGKKSISANERMDEVLPMASAEEAGKGRYSPEFLRAIDWALQADAKDRPQDVTSFQQALFGAHATGLGLQEALRAGESDNVVMESWRALIESPRLLKAHAKRIGKQMVRPASWPLAVKMTIAMVCAALLPMTITAYTNLKDTLATVSESELRNLEQHAHSAAGRLSQLINDSRNLANYLGTDDDFVHMLMAPTDESKEAIRIKLENLAKSNTDIHPLIVMDKDGTAVVSNDPGVTGKNFKFREYFKQAMTGRSYTTGIIVGATAGAAGVYYSNPVRDSEGTVIGTVVLRIKASTVASILAETNRGALTPFLIDSDGVTIYHPDQRNLYRSLAPLSEGKLKQIVAEQRFGQDRIESLNMPELARAMIGVQETGNISYTSTISKQEEVAGFAPVRGHNWVVGVTESREYVEKPLNRLFVNVLYSFAGVGIVFLVLAVLFARSIVRPVERLTQAAHALKDGDYEKANIKVKTDDEIGRLASTFNIMIDVLRQRDRESRRKQPSKRNDPLGLGLGLADD